MDFKTFLNKNLKYIITIFLAIFLAIVVFFAFDMQGQGVVSKNAPAYNSSQNLKERLQNQIRYKKDYEKDYEQKIKKALIPILGSDKKIVANVTIEFDFAQEDSVSEVYDPDSVARTENFVDEKLTQLNMTKNTSKTEYEISKKVTNKKDEFATIKRVSAAVVVDGKYKYDKKTNLLKYTPFERKELEKISSIVEQTIGYDKQRGDKVSVGNFEFQSSSYENLSPFEISIKKGMVYFDVISPFLKIFLVLIILLIFYKKVLSPFSKSMLNPPEPNKPLHVEKKQALKKKTQDKVEEKKDQYEIMLDDLSRFSNEKTKDFAKLLEDLVVEKGKKV